MGGTLCRVDRAPDQVARTLLPLPWFIVSSTIKATEMAEDILGHPPSPYEIFVVLNEHLKTPIRQPSEVAVVMMSMLREDFVMTDKISYRYTVRRQEGYYTFSERFRQNFGDGYECDSVGAIVPTTARAVNYSQLQQILLSKDESLFQENHWIWEGKFHLLDGSEKLGMGGHANHIMLTSFPRSGNSFLRRLTEQMTGICTGSAFPLMTATSLQIMGMKGEGQRGDRTWIVKSHHPFNYEWQHSFESQKTIMVVRNPLDVFPSYACLLNTISHGNKTEYEIHEKYPEWWAWFVKHNTGQMKRFFKTIKSDCVDEKKNPLYVVRYEDLVMKPKETLMGLFGFILGHKNL